MGRCETDNYGLQLGIFPRKYYNRWVVLTFYVVAEAFVGLPFSMGLFSEALKSNLGFTQANVDVISTIGLLGLCPSVFVGILLHMVKLALQRYFLLVAVCCISGGLLYMSMTLYERIPVNLGFMYLMWFIASLGTCILMAISLQIHLNNFPRRDRGKVCGMIIGMIATSNELLEVLLDSLFRGFGVYPEATFAFYLSCSAFSLSLSA